MAAAEEEDDYMSDSLLIGTNDVRPGLLFNRNQKRTHELLKQKEIIKKPKTYAETEKETREIGLETPISNENKGFQMLMKMGFKPGDKIGSNKGTTVGLKEPIKVVVKDLKTGLGHEAEIAEKRKNIVAHRKQQNRKLFDQFRTNTGQKKHEKLIQRDYEKVQRICEDMDIKNSVMEPTCIWYWPKRRQQKEEDDTEEDDSSSSDDEDEEEPLNTGDVNTNLQCILTYLRNTYNYCMYCVIKFENDIDMQQNCPGPSREDHDDD